MGRDRSHLACTIGSQQTEELVVLNGKPGVLDGPVVLAHWPPPPCTAEPPEPIPESHTLAVVVQQNIGREVPYSYHDQHNVWPDANG